MRTSYNPDVTRSLHELAKPRKPGNRKDPDRLAARRNPPPAFGQTALLHYEDPAEFETLRNSYIEEHQPETPTEHYFINEMANAQWRLRRLRTIEADLIRIRMSADPSIDDQAAQAEAVRLASDSTKALNFLLRQESALRRQYERALRMFWECRRQQEKRNEANAKAQPQKVTKRTQSSPELVTFMRRVSEFCAAPPPLPPPQSPQPPKPHHETGPRTLNTPESS
jgi:hypothetical protein